MFTNTLQLIHLPNGRNTQIAMKSIISYFFERRHITNGCHIHAHFKCVCANAFQIRKTWKRTEVAAS